jgi:hypothetical protein
MTAIFISMNNDRTMAILMENVSFIATVANGENKP